MVNSKLVKTSVILSILLLSSCFTNSYSQQKIESVALIFPMLSEHECPGKQVYRILSRELKQNDIQIDDLSQIGLIIVPTEIPEIKKTLITILYTRSLPDSIINFNINNEVKFLNDKSFNKSIEAKPLREYLTKELLYKYRNITFATFYRTILTSESEMEKELADFAKLIKVGGFLKG